MLALIVCSSLRCKIRSFREHFAAPRMCAAGMKAFNTDPIVVRTGAELRSAHNPRFSPLRPFAPASAPASAPPSAPPSLPQRFAALRRCAADMKVSIEAMEVRTDAELRSVQALIIPGGESTTMANLAQRCGLLGALQEFAASGRPMWGTCAGLIFLANKALGQKSGGQALLGGLDCTVHRNFFGSQINSFETLLPFPHHTLQSTSAATPSSEASAPPPPQSHPSLPHPSPDASPASPASPFRAVFIRAPAIIHTGPAVEVLAEYPLPNRASAVAAPAAPAAPAGAGSAEPAAAASAVPDQSGQELSEAEILAKLDRVAVAVRQGRLLATAFHPELTADLRWHRLFLHMILDALQSSPDLAVAQASAVGSVGNSGASSVPNVDPGDLPVFEVTRLLELEQTQPVAGYYELLKSSSAAERPFQSNLNRKGVAIGAEGDLLMSSTVVVGSEDKLLKSSAAAVGGEDDLLKSSAAVESPFQSNLKRKGAAIGAEYGLLKSSAAAVGSEDELLNHELLLIGASKEVLNENEFLLDAAAIGSEDELLKSSAAAGRPFHSPPANCHLPPSNRHLPCPPIRDIREGASHCCCTSSQALLLLERAAEVERCCWPFQSSLERKGVSIGAEGELLKASAAAIGSEDELLK
ncbi:unnamed protein product [Closterium sp. Yama58-4]|nr:unnamed protein product [Closterium sp. Yama58-4]